MNGYRAFMNRAKLSPEAHRRMMDALTGDCPVRRERPHYRRWGALAACCTLVLAVGLWALRPLSGTPPQPGVALPPDTVPPAVTTSAEPRWSAPPLAFADCNESSIGCGSLIMPPGYFFRDVEGTALAALLGPLGDLVTPDALTARALFSGKGELWWIALESADGNLQITVAPGMPHSDTVYGDATVISYHGAAVTAYWLKGDRDGDGAEEYQYFAEYLSGDWESGVRISYRHPDQETARAFVTEFVYRTTGPGNAFPLDGILPGEIPPWRSETMTLEEARAEAGLGAYLPAALPNGFSSSGAARELGQGRDWLSAYWSNGYDYISIQVNFRAGGNEIYPALSSMQSIRAEDLTADYLKGLGRYVDDDAGDTPGWRYDHFVVLYGEDIAVEYNLKGVTPEQALALIPAE